MTGKTLEEAMSADYSQATIMSVKVEEIWVFAVLPPGLDPPPFPQDSAAYRALGKAARVVGSVVAERNP